MVEGRDQGGRSRTRWVNTSREKLKITELHTTKTWENSNSWCLVKRNYFLSVSGVLTFAIFFDIVLCFEPADHTFHISKCLSVSTVQYLQFYRSSSGTPCIYIFIYILLNKNGRCGPGGRMRTCHAAGSASIPGRNMLPGWGFFGVFPHL